VVTAYSSTVGFIRLQVWAYSEVKKKDEKPTDETPVKTWELARFTMSHSVLAKDYVQTMVRIHLKDIEITTHKRLVGWVEPIMLRGIFDVTKKSPLMLFIREETTNSLKAAIEEYFRSNPEIEREPVFL
jgi:hypothetical protein